MLTKIGGTLVLIFAVLIIFSMILGGFKIAIDAIEEDWRNNMKRRAEDLAGSMYRDALRRTKIHVTQRIVIVDSDGIAQ